jgi:heptosyltransferase-3
VIHPWTRWPQKAWSEQNWIATGRHLLQRVPNLVISAGPDPEEVASASRIASALGDRAISTRGETSWAHLAGLLHRASLFVGVDTAAMHLAAACDCPTVALFGPSKIYEWRPWRVRHLVVRPQDWLDDGKPEQNTQEDPMRTIDLPRVTVACDEVLAGGGMRAPADPVLVVPR